MIGIYCQAIDRWIYIGDDNPHLALSAAMALSSKIATTVYVVPDDMGVQNSSCLNYSIVDKTKHTRGGVSDLITSQIPTLRRLESADQVKLVGYPVDFIGGKARKALSELKEYVEFVVKTVVVAEEVNATYNHQDNKVIADRYFERGWTDAVEPYADRSNMRDGFNAEIRKILYNAMSLKSARDKIDRMWKKNYKRIWWLADAYYDAIGVEHNFKK